MLQALRLALAGLRARWATSVALLLVLVVTLAAAVVGPVFLRAADEAAVRRAVREGPRATRVLAVESASASADPPAVLRAAREELARDPLLRRAYGPGTQGGESTTQTTLENVLPVVWRDDVCAHLVLRSGRCATAPGEVVLADPLPADEGWRLGGPVRLTPAAEVTVVGTYAPIDVQQPYWSGRGYDPAYPIGDLRDPKRRLGAAFTVAGTLDRFVDAGGRARSVLDLPLRSGVVTAQSAPALASAVAAFGNRLIARTPDAATTTELPAALARAAHERSALRLPVLLVTGQLLLLSLLVLLLVVDGTSSARAPEVALARLRGLGPLRVAAFGLLEVVLLVLLAAPLSLGTALLAVRATGRSRLGPGTPVVLTGPAVLALLGAVLVAVLAAGWAARDALRTPAAELLRPSVPRHRRVGAAGLAAALVLAVAGAAELRLGGGLRSDRLDAVALAAPGALALTVALVAARLLPLACRALVPLTRSRGPVAGFLAVRQLARRPGGSRSVVVVTAAVGLATFAAFATSVQQQNRHDRSLSDTGAPVVHDVRTDPGVDLQAAVRRAAPGGQALAALRYDSPSSGPGERHLLAVDSARLPAVGFWRSDLAPTGITEIARALAPPVAAPVLLQGDAVRLVLDARDETVVVPPPAGTPPRPADPPALRLELDGASGLRQQLELGAVRSGTVEVEVLGCSAAPCRFRGVRVTRTLHADPVAVALTVKALAVHRDGAWQDASTPLRDPGRWRTEAAGSAAPTSTADGLSVRLDGGELDDPALTVADSPQRLPAVVTAGALHLSSGLQVPGLDGQDRPATAVVQAALVPGLGPDAALADLTLADRSAAGRRSELVTPQVWAGPAAPADLVPRLAAAGVHVVATHRAPDREAALAAQGPALAVRLLVLAGGTATVLAAAGAALSLALLGRRRRYELAALQAAGLPQRSLAASVLLEQLALLSTGALLGLAAGLAGGRLAIRSVPQFDDATGGLPLLTTPRPGALAALLAAVVAVVLVAGVLAGLALLDGRGGRAVERLREAQA